MSPLSNSMQFMHSGMIVMKIRIVFIKLIGILYSKHQTISPETSTSDVWSWLSQTLVKHYQEGTVSMVETVRKLTLTPFRDWRWHCVEIDVDTVWRLTLTPCGDWRWHRLETDVDTVWKLTLTLCGDWHWHHVETDVDTVWRLALTPYGD